MPPVLSIFLKICMGAQKPPPELGYGGSGSKIQNKIFYFHAISLDEMVIGARALTLPQELDLFRTQAPGAPWVVQKLFLLLYHTCRNVYRTIRMPVVTSTIVDGQMIDSSCTRSTYDQKPNFIITYTLLSDKR